MRPIVLAIIAAPLIVLGASGDARAPSRNTVPAATPAGKPQSCIPIQSIRDSLVRSDSVIDFRTNGSRVYRVTLPQGCPGLGFERRFSYATSLGQLCAQDIITVFSQSPPMRGASCGLAPFQPVTLAPTKR